MAGIPIIDPWPATKATAASRMLWLADAYAEGAMVLCNAMAADDYYPQYTNTRVILHLCRHATELFFKGAIAVKTQQFSKTHRLDRLYAQYLTLYPLEKFQISLPFPRAVFNPSEGLFPELLDEYTQTHDQRFRYPIDNQGVPFFDAEPFDVAAYQAAIAIFQQELNLMVYTIDRGRKL